MKIIDDLLQQEWLHTNGIGGYAASTVSGANTRRYHGLLVASLNPPTARTVLVGKVEEELITSLGQRHLLGTNQYPNTIYPSGYRYLNKYQVSPYPKFYFQGEAFTLVKSIVMKRRSNTVFVEYANEGDSEIQLSLKPEYVFRDYHGMFHESEYYNFYMADGENGLRAIYAHYGAMPLYMKISKGEFKEYREWIKNVEYAGEQQRGLDFSEDYFSMGSWKVVLKPYEKVVISFSTDINLGSYDFDTVKDEVIAWQRSRTISNGDKFYNDLLLSADQFIVHRASTESHTIIAGYPWFTDWGRDTMIAMRGLTIATAAQEVSKSILKTFFQYLNEGMLPNRFPDNPQDAVEYNTVDATLWLFIVMYEYHQKFNDPDFVEDCFHKLSEVIQYHLEGTRYNIHTTPHGFLFAGEGIAQLTWMDARVGDFVVTPRHGCPVEVNVLWYNALMIYRFFASELGKTVPNRVLHITENFPEQFRKYFYNTKGYLNDVIIPDRYVDDSIRPNQVYALSLPFELLGKEESRSILRMVDNHLYTRLGLRTLNKENDQFKPVYHGDVWARDTAYHQGTVWPFLFGEYWTARMKHSEDPEKDRQILLVDLESLKFHFYNGNCLLGISEIFDGDNPNPYMGKGTVQQAWSVSNLIKLYNDFGLTTSRMPELALTEELA